jgi:hypothetical protein
MTPHVSYSGAKVGMEKAYLYLYPNGLYLRREDIKFPCEAVENSKLELLENPMSTMALHTHPCESVP